MVGVNANVFMRVDVCVQRSTIKARKSSIKQKRRRLGRRRGREMDEEEEK